LLKKWAHLVSGGAAFYVLWLARSLCADSAREGFCSLRKAFSLAGLQISGKQLWLAGPAAEIYYCAGGNNYKRDQIQKAAATSSRCCLQSGLCLQVLIYYPLCALAFHFPMEVCPQRIDVCASHLEFSRGFNSHSKHI